MEDRDLYEEAKQKGKLLLIGFVSALILIGLILMIVKIVENANQPKPPVFEIKLYDDNWVELEKDSSGNYFTAYQVTYDGTKKGFNAIGYKDGAEFYRYNYKTSSDEKYPKPIRVSFQLQSGLSDFPSKKGEYTIYYEFNQGSGYGWNVSFDTLLGVIHCSELPKIKYSINIEIL